MAFTTPCFVRIEDAEKREEVISKLEEMGYIIACNHTEGCGLYTSNAYMDGVVFAFRKEFYPVMRCINCSTNIDLFLAIAGMRDDTDKDQWFSRHYFSPAIGPWMVKSDFDEFGGIKVGGWEITLAYWYRSTAEEIVEYFKGIE